MEGHVTPDSYVVDRKSFDIKDEVVSDKPTMIVPAEKVGTTSKAVPMEKRNHSSLSRDRLRQLAELALQVEGVFDGHPQDIEWAVSEDQCYLLQSRPITHLPAPPLKVAWDPPTAGAVLIRRQVVENMPAPLSPLFEELYLTDGLEASIDQFLVDFGMQGVDVSLFLDRPMFLTVNGYALLPRQLQVVMEAHDRSTQDLVLLHDRHPQAVEKLSEPVARWSFECLPAKHRTLENH